MPCNELWTTYGCGPEGSRSDFQGIPLRRELSREGIPWNPAAVGVAFVRSTNPKANCRLERTTYEMTALSASPFVRDILSYLFCRIFVNLTFPELTRSALPLWDDNQDGIHSIKRNQNIYRLMQAKNITWPAKPDIYETRAERTFALRRQSRWNTLTQIGKKQLLTCSNQNMTQAVDFFNFQVQSTTKYPSWIGIFNIYSQLIWLLRYVSEAFKIVPNILGKPRRIRAHWSSAQALRHSNSIWEDSYIPLELECRAMSFERLTDAGPKGREATFKGFPRRWELSRRGIHWNPAAVGVAFVRSTNPKANCRLERTTMRRLRCRLHRLLGTFVIFFPLDHYVNLTFPEHTRSALSFRDENQD